MSQNLDLTPAEREALAAAAKLMLAADADDPDLASALNKIDLLTAPELSDEDAASIRRHAAGPHGDEHE